jgi:hypothetical protein
MCETCRRCKQAQLIDVKSTRPCCRFDLQEPCDACLLRNGDGSTWRRHQPIIFVRSLVRFDRRHSHRDRHLLPHDHASELAPDNRNSAWRQKMFRAIR